jgi:ATP-dependent DNA helicase RecG
MSKKSCISSLDFLSALSTVPGLGPKRVEALHESGIETIGDLLYYFPRRYIDRSIKVPLDQVKHHEGEVITVEGEVTRARLEKGRKGRFRALLTSAEGELELIWFQGVQYHKSGISTGMKLIATGKISYYGKYQIVHPLIDKISENGQGNTHSILPLYSICSSMREAGIQNRILMKAIEWTINNLSHFPQVIPEIIISQKNFPSLKECLYNVHFPSSLSTLDRYKTRIKYEEFYKIGLTVYWNKKKFLLPGRSMKPGNFFDKVKGILPFKLTSEQQKAIDVLFADALDIKRMHRLLQGDVGSGKTVVALCACTPALYEGYQVVWMAPTEILAIQTFKLVLSWLQPLGIKVGLMKGGSAVSQRKELLSSISNGELQFIVGTHALLQPSVVFKNAGMMVIDEQHKFGARQRLTLQEKNPESDFLLMSATPIPQTLARTLYGDLDLVSILKCPEGRTPVSTHLVPEDKRRDMESFVLDRIKSGERVYYVVPRIESQDEFDESEVKNVETVYDQLIKGTLSSVNMGYIHGKMSADEKELKMNEFLSGKTPLIVATQLIEVGMDVPDATVMIIENAERFGLAQLHQLRGRVGRGSKKSYCFLFSAENCDEDAKKRLLMFCKENDGFKIAEMDLKFRGPGQVSGMKQSGWDDQVMSDIINDIDLFREVQEQVEKLLSSKFVNN